MIETFYSKLTLIKSIFHRINEITKFTFTKPFKDSVGYIGIETYTLNIYYHENH